MIHSVPVLRIQMPSVVKDLNNNYIKPFQAFFILITLSMIVALGRYFSVDNKHLDLIINFSPVVAAMSVAILCKLFVDKINSKIFLGLAFSLVFSLWGYQQFLNTSQLDQIILLACTMLLIWHSALSKWNLILSLALLLAFVLVLKYLAMASNTLIAYYAIAGGMSLAVAAYILNMLNASIVNTKPLEQQIKPIETFINNESEDSKPVISLLQVNEKNNQQDWGELIKNLYDVLKAVPDVDLMFNKTLQYMHKIIEYDAAVVGMIQDKSINKIAELGPENLLHSSVVDWTSSRINEVKNQADAILGQQKHLGAENKNIDLYRMDIPIRSNNNFLGIISIFRSTTLFNEYETQLAKNIVFHCMLALRQSRLQEEVKRLSVSGKTKTLFSREQFIEKSNLNLDNLSKPRAFSILIIEIDNFEQIKDQYGAESSLSAYKKVATSLMSSLGEQDILGRYGKEGFIILLHEKDLLDAKKVAENIRKKIEQTKFKIPDGVSSTTVSIGLTTVSDQNENMMSIIRKADMGLFVAKESGYNTVKVSL